MKGGFDYGLGSIGFIVLGVLIAIPNFIVFVVLVRNRRMR